MHPASGALVICIRADLFRSEAEQTASVEALRARLHASGREIEVLAPGELERRARSPSGRVEVDADVLALLEAPG
jgi:LDH2 family malate/lactate/ureidoglycolate dehydrogenase